MSVFKRFYYRLMIFLNLFLIKCAKRPALNECPRIRKSLMWLNSVQTMHRLLAGKRITPFERASYFLYKLVRDDVYYAIVLHSSDIEALDFVFQIGDFLFLDGAISVRRVAILHTACILFAEVNPSKRTEVSRAVGEFMVVRLKSWLEGSNACIYV